ncbi:hypothetical protein [Streptomyces noursei]|uniref:hypothetical protein n=1 Tax=Streptomyces noursei TaxID=1971 RepID=UPI003EB84681
MDGGVLTALSAGGPGLLHGGVERGHQVDDLPPRAASGRRRPAAARGARSRHGRPAGLGPPRRDGRAPRPRPVHRRGRPSAPLPRPAQTPGAVARRRPLRRTAPAPPWPRQTDLTDESVLAGLGNPLADEILWRAGLHPTRRASDLTEAERTPSPLHTFAAHPALRGHRRPDPAARLLAHRPPRRPRPGPPPLRLPPYRSRMAGRGTVWCPRCQPDD